MSDRIDEHPITDTVAEFFTAIESDKWDTAATLLADHVHVIHGPEEMTLSRADLITGWKENHTAYARTTYQLGPFTIEHTGPREATIRCSSRATLHQPSELGGPPEVIVGQYTIDLEQESTDTWRITTMRHDQHA